MGNPLFADAARRVRLFASSSSWIEEAATRQLKQTLQRPGIIAVAGMPDLHPGHHGPVGCAALAEGVVHPDLVGTDIGCGMAMWALDLPARRLRADKAADRLAALEGEWDGDAVAEVEAAGLSATGFEAALGTVGGGNHFCEVQTVHEIVDANEAVRLDLARGSLALLVHSGSRAFGAAVYARHRRDGIDGLPLEEGGGAYLAEHDIAVRFASVNRAIIAARAMQALRCDGAALLDLPHNFAARDGDRVLHRKGAAPADRGLVPIPGSRGDETILVKPTNAVPEALTSIAHGAGRKFDRGSMEGRVRRKPGDIERLRRNPFGGHVVCTDRQLLVEEAPEAYKDVRRVVADLESHRLATVVAILRPVVTFKTAREARAGGRS